jgi:DnaJ-class molecular chaperone
VDHVAQRYRRLDAAVVLRVPPGTQPGRKFHIKGQGIERNGQGGDQLAQIKVTLPETLTPEQQELVKQFGAAAGLAH